jgi:hypothetical protein
MRQYKATTDQPEIPAKTDKSSWRQISHQPKSSVPDDMPVRSIVTFIPHCPE